MNACLKCRMRLLWVWVLSIMGNIKSSSSSSSVKSQASINLFCPSLIVSSKVFQVHLTYNSAVFLASCCSFLLQKSKWEQQQFLRNCGADSFALEWCLTTAPHIDVPICGDHHTVDELHSTLSISKGSLMAITKELCYSNVCSCWVPQMVKAVHKEMRKAMVTDILQ